jgi:hypothetical protein
MKEDVESIGLAYIWHSQQESYTKRLKAVMREKKVTLQKGKIYFRRYLKRFQ